jgi:beta-galactosidase GanA
LIPGKNDFNKVIDNLNTIKISIEEMIDRVEEEGLKLEKSEYNIDKTTGHERVVHTFEIYFISNEISTEELKDTFNTYKSSQDKEYLNGLKQLRNIYREEGIDFDRYMDTTDDDEYTLIGVFIGEDLYGVASYNTQTKQFTIDEDEIVASVNAYREENQ